MRPEAFTAFKRGAQARAVLKAELERLNSATFRPPADLAKRVRAFLAKNPTLPWGRRLGPSGER